MTDLQPPLTLEAPSPLPTTHILTYITGDATAPRLRRVVFWGLSTMALLHMLAFFYLAWTTEETIRNNWEYYAYTTTGPFAPRSILTIARYAAKQNSFDLLSTLVVAALAVTLLICAKPASRGRRTPALISMAALCPFILAALVAAAMSTGLSLILAFFNRVFDPAPLQGLLIAPPAALIALLTKDLLAYIRWAAKNPMQEKPPTPFLPRADIAPPPTLPQSLEAP
jgi:hypothetical protein